jgi:YHS domain-containing protein
MNRIQNVHSTRPSGKTKQTINLPTIRLSFAVFALWALVATSSNASNVAPEKQDLTRPGVQVWLTKGQHKLNLDSKGVILKGYDPVAYLALRKAVKGSPKYQTTYEGAIYYFSSPVNLATFKKNPSKYVPQYGGFCANGLAHKQANDIDPNVFFVVKGKLYVCTSPAAEKEFQSNLQENIKKADQNWGEEYRWFY